MTDDQAARAFSYVRWSSAKQSDGDSRRRQDELAKDWCKAHGVELDNRTFVDMGISAYRGRNATTGALAMFRRAVEDGVIPERSYLLVESLDRVTRADLWDALDLFRDIIRSGVKLVTLSDGKVYTRKGINENPMDLMAAILLLVRANEESRMKSRRVQAVWDDRRSQAETEGRQAFGQLPGWIRPGETAGTGGTAFEIDEEKAEVIRQMVQWTLEGTGIAAIAQRLNRQGVKPFRYAKLWTPAVVKRLLKSQTLIGTWERTRTSPETKKREAIEPLKNYYPAIIDEETFWEVQRLLDGRLPKYRNNSAPRNALAGLALCPLCGSPMYRKGRGANRQQVLICSTAMNGGPCLRANVNLEVIKETLTGMIDQLLLEMPSGSRDINKQLEHIEGEIEGIDAREDALVDTLSSEILSEAQRAPILKKLGALQDRRASLQKAQRALWKDSADFTGEDRLAKELKRSLAAWSQEEGLILEANKALRSLFSHIVVDWPNQRLIFHWKADPEIESHLPLFFSDRVIKGHAALVLSGSADQVLD